ncbi:MULTISPECIES: pyridoxamine kinase [Congzhengia]|uniref:pyridoxal kinase n=1 Tax=Congzhengia minquanensis TaxID=2763657 RepID=A0A926HZJ8_9FIRM|nr:pyridoxamine kinase [Congzhengia minquanensis]MBC8541250.1 pyridoxamine kinase [Congzhengia minquanensis]
MNRQKRIIAINDISCFGKCSLTAAIPILSAAGIETCVLPTAVLSSHTGFSGYTFRDLTDDLLMEAEHWKSLGLTFDGIYTGYLASKRQVSCVEKIMELLPSEFVLVDPVMGDNGRLYDGFDESFAKEMKRLLQKADIIVPNVTEAAFLTDVPFESGTHSQDYIETMIEKLKPVCRGQIVLTGIHSGPQKVGTAVWDGVRLEIIETEKIDVFYSGTGDVFASALAAAVMLGKDTKKAAEIAAEYVIDCILKTRKTSGDRSYGVNFELCTKELLAALGLLS